MIDAMELTRCKIRLTKRQQQKGSNKKAATKERFIVHAHALLLNASRLPELSLKEQASHDSRWRSQQYLVHKKLRNLSQAKMLPLKKKSCPCRG